MRIYKTEEACLACGSDNRRTDLATFDVLETCADCGLVVRQDGAAVVVFEDADSSEEILSKLKFRTDECLEKLVEAEKYIRVLTAVGWTAYAVLADKNTNVSDEYKGSSGEIKAVRSLLNILEAPESERSPFFELFSAQEIVTDTVSSKLGVIKKALNGGALTAVEVTSTNTAIDELSELFAGMARIERELTKRAVDATKRKVESADG